MPHSLTWVDALPQARRIQTFALSRSPADVRQYVEHWQPLLPRNEHEVFDRWLFAFCSIHTTWQMNVRAYQAIQGKVLSEAELLPLLLKSGVGLQNHRAQFIGQFTTQFWKSPHSFSPTGGEPWRECRNRLEKSLLGIGPAKTSFALELVAPHLADVVCLDTHMFQAYGMDQTKENSHYAALEEHWVRVSRQAGIPPAMLRFMYWDQKQKKSDSGYWSWVFQRPTPNA